MLLQPLLLPSAGNILHRQTQAGVVTERSMKQISQELVSVVTKWRDIGIQLDLELHILKRIEVDNPRSSDRFSEMIVEWIKTMERPTWKQIVVALRDKSVNEPVLAGRIEEKFCTDDYTTFLQQSDAHTPCIWMTPIAMLIVILLLVTVCVPLIYVYHNSLMKSFYVMQSKTLPYISDTFVGRNEELFNISRLLDFEQTRTRVVSITGPPGFGKSTLAIKVGHNFAEEGYTVLYFNMHTVLTVQVLAEKVLKGANIPRKRVTIDRVYQWVRDMSHMSGHTLLVFDNCDDIIRENKDQFQRVVQELLQSSHFIKVLMTSRQKATFLDDSFEFCLKEFTAEASSSLLSAIVVSNVVSKDERLTLAEITGNVPLALRILGSLLNTPDPPSAKKIISELQSELIETLSREELPSHYRIQASLNLSYKYLSQSEKHCAQVLALFPGSFSLNAADAIISGVDQMCIGFKKKCWDVLFQRSLLQFDQRLEQYSYHILLRTFFQYKLRRERKWNETQIMFRSSFQEYYGHMLQDLSLNFKLEIVKVLNAFDLQKHNIELFVQHTLSSVECEVRSSIEAVALALDSGLLQCRFNFSQLIKLTKTIVVSFEKNIGINHWDHNWFFKYYAKLVSHWARFEIQFRSYSAANHVLSKRWPIIESRWSKANDPTLSVHYINFYIILSETYETLGQKEDVLKCQVKITEKSDMMENCVPGDCDYEYLGVIYYNAGNYERSIHFFELGLQFPLALERKTECLIYLYRAYTKLWQSSDANNVLDSIVLLLPQVLSEGSLNTLTRLTNFFTKIDKPDQATVVMDKLLSSLFEIKVYDHSTSKVALSLVEVLCKNQNYSKAIEVGKYALKYLELSEDDTAIYRAKVYAILLFAEFQLGNFAVSLKYLDECIALFENTHHVENCQYTLKICIYFMWLKPRCFKEIIFCIISEFEIDLGELQKQSVALDGIAAPSSSKEITIYSDDSFPILTSIFNIYTFVMAIENLMVKCAAPYIIYITYFVNTMFVVWLAVVVISVPYMAFCGHITHFVCLLCNCKSIFCLSWNIVLITNIVLLYMCLHWLNVLLFIITGCIGFLLCIVIVCVYTSIVVSRLWFTVET